MVTCGAWEGAAGTSRPPHVVVLWWNVREPLAPPSPQIGLFESAAWREMEAMLQVPCWL